jgi:hypothetical protein
MFIKNRYHYGVKARIFKSAVVLAVILVIIVITRRTPDEIDVPAPFVAAEVTVSDTAIVPAVWDGWDSVAKDFLLGKVIPAHSSLFVKVEQPYTERNIYLLRPVYEAFVKMYDNAHASGIRMIIMSGHRTFFEQACEWDPRWITLAGENRFGNDLERTKHLLQYRSMPGTSRHHWGTDIDLNSIREDYFQSEEGRMLYEWLEKNAPLYGFYQPYTVRCDERKSGYCEEKWHWSYRPIAQLMLEKYVATVSKEDIKGFKGDRFVKDLDIISDWVCGIDKSLYDTLIFKVNSK